MLEENRRLRIFVASAADLLTDHISHGEGLLAWETFSALAARGHELVVCARKVDIRSTPQFEIIETGRALRWESLEPVAYALRVRRVLRRFGGADGFDAIHWFRPHEPICFIPPNGANYVIGPRTAGWPANSSPPRPRRAGDTVRRLLGPGLAAIRWSAYARADAILVSTPSATEELPRRYRRRAEVRTPGVDDVAFSSYPLPDEPTVIYVGRLERSKHVRELIEAFGQLLRSIPQAKLVLAGDGPERAWISSRCSELGISHAVTLLGRISHSMVPEVLQGSSVLCLPSRGEPLGMVVLEAMATGRAVVAVALGGPAWLVEPDLGGILVPSGTVDDLAEALVTLLSDRTRLERMARHNRARVETHFSLDRFVEGLERAYRGVA